MVAIPPTREVMAVHDPDPFRGSMRGFDWFNWAGNSSRMAGP